MNYQSSPEYAVGFASGVIETTILLLKCNTPTPKILEMLIASAKAIDAMTAERNGVSP